MNKTPVTVIEYVFIDGVWVYGQYNKLPVKIGNYVVFNSNAMNLPDNYTKYKDANNYRISANLDREYDSKIFVRTFTTSSNPIVISNLKGKLIDYVNSYIDLKISELNKLRIQ